MDKVLNLGLKPKSGPRRIGFGGRRNRIASAITIASTVFSRKCRKATQPQPQRQPQFKTLDMDAKPRPHTLEITVISGENICLDRNPMAENAYVVVRPESINCYTTKMAKTDGGLLAWNEKFLLDIPMHARSVTFEVQCEEYKGVRPVGGARIALSDLIGGGRLEENCIQMFSYRLRDWDGRRNGVIHFSVREATTSGSEIIKPLKGITAVSSCGSENQVMANEKNSNDVVLGIPVWWGYHSNI